MSKPFKKQDAVVLFSTLSLTVENETTLSFYNHDAYEEFKANPEEKWM
jgi:hypothetical protein